MSDQNNNRPSFPKSILDHRSVGLSTEAADKGKWASMRFDVDDKGNFVIKVWPNDTEDAARNRGPIQAEFVLSMFQNLMGAIRQAVSASLNKKEFWQKIQNNDYPWINDRETGRRRRGDEMKPVSAVIVGVDKDFRIYLSLEVWKRPNIQFFFGKTVYNAIYDKSGQFLPDDEVSRAFARGLTETLDHVVPTLIMQRYNHEKTLPKNKQNQGGSGGGNNNYSGSNNYNRGGGNGGNNYPPRQQDSAPADTSSFSLDMDDADVPY